MDSEIVRTADDTDSGDTSHTRQNDNKTRMRLKGTAVLERHNQPVLSATYEYWTDHADNFFQDQVDNFQSMEINKIAFGVNCYPDRNMRKLISGSDFKTAKAKTANTWVDSFQMDLKPLTHSDHIWTKPEVVENHYAASPRNERNRRSDIFKGFVAGITFCMFVFILYNCLFK